MSQGDNIVMYGTVIALLSGAIALAVPYLHNRAAALESVLRHAKSFWARVSILAREHVRATTALLLCLLVLLPLVLLMKLGAEGLSDESSSDPDPRNEEPAPLRPPPSCPTAILDAPDEPDCGILMFADTGGTCTLPSKIIELKMPPPEDAKLYCLLLKQRELENRRRPEKQ